MKETKRETARRIERLLDEYGFCGAIGLMAKSVDDSFIHRDDKLYILQMMELNLRRYVREAARSNKENKIELIDALANDTRGNENERASAKAMADKLRGKVA